ncbi:5'-methylthioadenosine/S-adenosylhomocysteine nucleosidase [Pseudogracilibacillus sp. SE30717A]|uniref:5'-methylthioadenosine/S-adenosylhomocysteine nucleosidase n=1 Tax=Pseudogracilibacillus sp. SE30717A TaxID=3098293 RepID=UPI00300DED84
MKFGIIGAMDEEIQFLKEIMTDKKETTIANVLFVEGKIDGKDTVLLKSGIGKVNAAMATSILMERFKPTLVINTGSAGGFSKDLNVGDVVVGEQVVHHDVDVTAFDYEYGQVPQMPPVFEADQKLIAKTKEILKNLAINSEVGLIATGDSFMSDPERVQFVRKKFPKMLAAEMEGAAIAQICFQYDVPFVIIRALSDIAGVESSISFNEFLGLAARNAANLITQIIKSS